MVIYVVLAVLGACYVVVALGVAGSIDERPLGDSDLECWVIMLWPVALVVVVVHILRRHAYGSNYWTEQRGPLPHLTSASVATHVFDPISNGADECECGLIESAPEHQLRPKGDKSR